MPLQFSQYKSDMHTAISRLDRTGQCKFAAWCCNVILTDEEVRDCLSRRPGGRTFLRALESVLDDIRRGPCADRQRVEALVETTEPFLPDGILRDIEQHEAAGRSRVLSSLEVIDAFLGWGLSGNLAYLEECAVARLDWVGMVNTDEERDDCNLLRQEALNQLQVLHDLQSDRRPALVL